MPTLENSSLQQDEYNATTECNHDNLRNLPEQAFKANDAFSASGRTIIVFAIPSLASTIRLKS
jgi:hypothetical protein